MQLWLSAIRRIYTQHGNFAFECDRFFFGAFACAHLIYAWNTSLLNNVSLFRSCHNDNVTFFENARSLQKPKAIILFEKTLSLP